MNARTIKPLLDSGTVSLATIDDKVRRILRMEIACCFLDRPQEDVSIPRDDPRSAEIALRIAREGFVLVKNDRAPLKDSGMLFFGRPFKGERRGGIRFETF